MLLDRKAAVKLQSDPERTSPLLAAAWYGKADTVRVLLDRRAVDINETQPSRKVTIAEMRANLGNFGGHARVGKAPSPGPRR